MSNSEFSAAAAQAVTDGTVAGMVVALGRSGEVTYCRAFGHAALVPTRQAMAEESLFDLASLTKVLATTTLTMRLWDRGGIDLDRSLGSLAPGRYPGDKAGLTPRLLLAHAAGLPPHVPFQHQFPPDAGAPDRVREEVLARARQVPLAQPPGTATVYSDLGMILLGDLLEALLGMPLDRAFESEVAAPLRLRNTFFIDLTRPLTKAVRPPEAFAATERCAWRGRLVRGQVHDENAFLLRGVAGHAGLFSTAGEVAVLAGEILASLAGDGALLSQRAAREMLTPQPIAGTATRALGWGLNGPGSSCGSRFSPRAFGHTGFTGTSVWLDPEDQRFVVLLANRVHPSRDNDRFLRFRPILHDLAVNMMDRLSGNRDAGGGV